jgi:fatty acid desaturase
VLALRPAQPLRVLAEHGGHHLQTGAHGQGSRPSFADSAISAIDTITCSGTAISPGCRSGWARWRFFWWVLLTAVPFLCRMTWRLPDTYHSAGHGRGTATLKFYEGRDILRMIFDAAVA